MPKTVSIEEISANLPQPGRALLVPDYLDGINAYGAVQEIERRPFVDGLDSRFYLCEPNRRKTTADTLAYLAGEPHLQACVGQLGKIATPQGLNSLNGEISNDETFESHRDLFRSLSLIGVLEGSMDFLINEELVRAKYLDLLIINNLRAYLRRAAHAGIKGTGWRVAAHFQK